MTAALDAEGAEGSTPVTLHIERGNGGVIPPRVTSPGRRGLSSVGPGAFAADIVNVSND